MGKLRKFMFTKETNYLLLQEMRDHDAHRAPRRKKNEALKKAKETLVDNIPEVTWLRYQKLQMETVRDQLRSLLASRREESKWHTNTSGVEEVIGTTEELLDEFIVEVDDLDEEKRRERKEMTRCKT